MAMTKVFEAGNSQAVRIPKEFRFKRKEIEILREGDDVILREKPMTLGEALARIKPDPNFMRGVVIDDPRPQKRKGW